MMKVGSLLGRFYKVISHFTLDDKLKIMETLYSKNADKRQKIEVAFQEHYQTYNVSLYDIN